MMFPTPFTELNQVLDELVARIQKILASDLVGLYLQGSFAVGDYDQYSDVDFIVVVEDELSPIQVDALQLMHGEVYRLDSEWAKHLEGSYFPVEILRDYSRCGEQLWFLDHGAQSLIRSDHCNTLLVRSVVRENGISLAGPPPKSLLDPISPHLLREEIYETLHKWGHVILENPADYSNWFYQCFIVLSYCRMLHDLYHGRPGTKREGAEWAKTVLDPAWTDLIDRTWAGRPDPAQKIKLPADPEDFEKTLQFVKHIMNESKRHYSKEDRNNLPIEICP
jgi:predicted nucleotidyltransferase